MSDYAFIVHSRDRSDLPRKFPWLSFLPTFMFDWVTLNLPPFVVSKITGLISSEGTPINGIVVGIPMTARQLLERRERATKKIVQAVKLARGRGATYIGLGAMTASLSRGGKDVIDNVKDVYVTTGRTYTVANITKYIETVVERFQLNKSQIPIAIVGAAGGIGSGVAVALARAGYKNFLLIDLERKLLNLRKHMANLHNHAQDLGIRISHKVADIESSLIIVAATSSPEIVIKSEDVNSGSIIINDAQPSDVSPEILKNRQDVLVIEGGVLKAPNLDCHINLGLQNKNDIFSCLAETLLLAYTRSEKHHSIDEFDPELYMKLDEVGGGLGFSLSMQNNNGPIDEKYLRDFATIVAQRQAQ